MLAAGGVDDRSAAWFIDVVFLFINANAYETSISVAEGSDDQRVVERLQEEFSGLSAERFPNFVRLLPLSMTGSREQRFDSASAGDHRAAAPEPETS